MDKQEIVLLMNRLAVNIDDLIKGGWQERIVREFMPRYIQQLRRLAREVEALPEPGRMRDVLKHGGRW